MIEMNYTGLLASRINQIDNDKLEIIKFTNWALSNLCRGKVIDKARQSVAVFSFLKVVNYQNDMDILEEAILALADLVDEDDVKLIVETNILKKLYLISKNCTVSMLNSILEIINQVSYVSMPECSNAIIESGFVGRLYEILNDDIIPVILKKDCLWVISNLTVESSEVISKVVNSKERFEILSKFSQHENKNVKREAIQCLCNITNKGSLEQKQFLVDNGIFNMFSRNLTMDTKPKLISTILEALDNILSEILTLREDLEEYIFDLLEDSGLVDCLEDLLQHKESKIYKASLNIIESYLEIQETI